MAVFMMVECPNCHKRLSVSSKVCRTKTGAGCGLDLNKMKKANKVFYWIAYRLPGEKNPRWERFKARGDAESYKADREAGIDQKKYKTKDDLIEKPKPQDTMTFHQLTKWYLEQEYVKVKKSLFQKQNSLKNFNKVFGDRIVSSVTVADLRNFQATREEKDKAARSTIDQETGEAGTAIRAAYKDNLVDESVLRRFGDIKKLLKRGSNKRTVIFTQGQYRAVYQKILPRSKAPFLLMRWSGMREGETLSLSWNGVLPLEDRVIRLEAAQTKDNEDRVIPMTGEVFFCLKELYDGIEDQENIGATRIFSVNKDQFIRDVRGACQEAGVTYGRKGGFTAHSLRHTFNTEMALAGVPQYMIQEFTGHSSDEMFKRYLHLHGEVKRQAIEKFEDHVLNGQSVNQSVN